MMIGTLHPVTGPREYPVETAVDLNRFLSRIEDTCLTKYDELRKSALQITLSSSGEVSYTTNRGKTLSLRDLLCLVTDSISAKLKDDLHITFRPNQEHKPYINLAERIHILTQARDMIPPAIEQYKQTRSYRFFTFAETRTFLDQAWQNAQQILDEKIQSLQVMPDALTSLEEVVKRGASVYRALADIEKRFSANVFPKQDFEQLTRLKNAATRLSDNIKYEKRNICQQLGDENYIALEHECYDLENAITKVEDIYATFLGRQECAVFYEIDPSRTHLLGDLDKRYKRALHSAVSADGPLDWHMVNQIQDELAACISTQAPYFDQMLERYRTKVWNFRYRKTGDCAREFIQMAQSSKSVLDRLKTLFIATEQLRLCHRFQIPYTFGEPLIEPLLPELSDDPCKSIEELYCGLLLPLTGQLNRVNRQQTPLKELTAQALNNLIDKIRAKLRSDNRIPLADVDRILQFIFNKMSEPKQTPTDFTLQSGLNSLRVHTAALLRLSDTMPTYFGNLMNGRWNLPNGPVSEIPAQLSWSGVLLFVSWLYGWIAVMDVPPILTKPFIDAADYFMSGAEIPERLAPLYV
ncbi:MAG: hypothetical protein JSS12_09005 [Verrucomicrobia bacterium]|nr:hypothetical protein [Verrucomicrobiota bacterium]